MNYFLDTSALIKLYHPERGSTNLETYLENTGEDLFLIIAGITPIEVRSAFYRRVRQGELSPDTMKTIMQRFHHDLQFIETVTVSNHLIHEAMDLMDHHATQVAFRTLDAMQLASANIHHQTVAIDVFIAADTNLLQVASQFFPTYNPLES